MTVKIQEPEQSESKYAETARAFRQNVKKDLANAELRENFHGAMNYLMAKRAASFPSDDELETLRNQCKLIKQRALLKLPYLLEKLESNLQANGIHVHWAETITDANEIIAQVITSKNGKHIVKGKSMVSEETALNDYLHARDMEILESDMGEYIVQLAHEHPSHIIMPAIHQNKKQVADLFDKHIDGFDYTTDVDALIGEGRRILRDKFCHADVGITGVNFAVAETGTLCLVENEGNGQMSSAVPNVHIALTGIEKVVELLEDVPPLLSLLTRSATGQAITTYFNMITKPRQSDEKDGPEEVHLVLLDNGRSQAFADEELRQTLQCIRCGACMNHCPVYTRIGGHAYGTVYPGPIGKIISPHMLGLEATKDLPTASSLCGACGEVCPVKIPIPKILQRLRTESVKVHSGSPDELKGAGSNRKPMEATIWKIWSFIHKHQGMYRFSMWVATRLRGLLPSKLGVWTQVRSAPQLAPKTLHERIQARQPRG
ncbi:iron-sulfur cluster-binding protein [Thalassotalea litorea]|uniref:Iron-sulfur cluster-binding protein n=1 Tax=Thalassotalea litorea TaxID=2020715 RepID=A0A5R9INT9_9GAMM|nr:LutB/LldF family L-lactate oxidation iron-sulfur protein [Thalassotalea litorea]TLU65737.1 iron-sulfur cluster-binding protein [Thalassotalea litorea]